MARPLRRKLGLMFVCIDIEGETKLFPRIGLGSVGKRELERYVIGLVSAILAV